MPFTVNGHFVAFVPLKFEDDKREAHGNEHQANQAAQDGGIGEAPFPRNGVNYHPNDYFFHLLSQ